MLVAGMLPSVTSDLITDVGFVRPDTLSMV